MNESGDFDVNWDGINGTVVLCSFNTLNVSVSSDGLSKGDYEAHLVVDSESDSGAEGMTISFSVSVTSSLIHSSFEMFYNGSETDSSWLEGVYGKVNESSGSNFKVRNDEEVLVLVEPRDLDDLPILSPDDLIEVDVNGSSCVESSSHPLLDDYHRLFECSFSHLDVGLRYLDISIEDHSIGLRVVNVSCKDSMIELNGSCSCSLGEELDGDDCSSCDDSSFKDWVGDGPLTRFSGLVELIW